MHANNTGHTERKIIDFCEFKFGEDLYGDVVVTRFGNLTWIQLQRTKYDFRLVKSMSGDEDLDVS